MEEQFMEEQFMEEKPMEENLKPASGFKGEMASLFKGQLSVKRYFFLYYISGIILLLILAAVCINIGGAMSNAFGDQYSSPLDDSINWGAIIYLSGFVIFGLVYLYVPIISVLTLISLRQLKSASITEKFGGGIVAVLVCLGLYQWFLSLIVSDVALFVRALFNSAI